MPYKGVITQRVSRSPAIPAGGRTTRCIPPPVAAAFVPRWSVAALARGQVNLRRRLRTSGLSLFPPVAVGAFARLWDALRIYGSGAVADGGAQADPDANFGGYRSSTEAASLAVFGAISGFDIERAGEGHAAGLGVIESDGISRLRWTASEAETPGPWIEAGSSVVLLHDADTPEMGLRLRRNSGDFPVAGNHEIKLLEIYNGPFGFDNVSDSERDAGDVEYRALFFRNEGLAPIDVTLTTASSGLAFGHETPGVGGDIQTIADEDTAPAAVAFDVGDSFTLAPGAAVGVWLRRTILASADGSAVQKHLITCTAEISGVEYTLYLRGRYRIAETALERYELYAGQDAAPDLDAAALETFTSLPHETAATFASGHTHHLVLRLRNRYGLVSQNRVAAIIAVDPGGDEYDSVSDPKFVVAAAAGSTVDVDAQYEYDLDDSPADVWVVWWNVGSAPTLTDPPDYAETMVQADGLAKLDYNVDDGFSNDDEVYVVVRARRLPGSSDDPDWAAETAYELGDYLRPGNGFAYECTAAGTSDVGEPVWPTVEGGTVVDNDVEWTCRAGVESTNDTALSVSADDVGPAQPDGGAFLGEAAEQI